MAAHDVVQPPSMTPMVDKGGFPTPAWIRFFVALVSLPPAVEVETLGASPFSYTASHAGNLLVKGGTVSAISITRGRTTIVTGATSGFVPLCQGDTAAVTFTVAPSVWFIPFQ